MTASWVEANKRFPTQLRTCRTLARTPLAWRVEFMTCRARTTRIPKPKNMRSEPKSQFFFLIGELTFDPDSENTLNPIKKLLPWYLKTLLNCHFIRKILVPGAIIFDLNFATLGHPHERVQCPRVAKLFQILYRCFVALHKQGAYSQYTLLTSSIAESMFLMRSERFRASGSSKSSLKFSDPI